MRENTYKTHQKILGAIFIAYGVINLVGGITLLVTVNIVNIFVDEPEVIQVVAIFSRLIGGILVLTSIPAIITGIGSLQEKNWSRNLGLVVGIIYLLFIPIGTVIGIYTIWLNSQTVIKDKQPVYATDLVKNANA
jgi:Na+-driven multidrug efflux pump